MKKSLALKINSQEEADFCGQILKEVDLCFHDHLPFNDTVSRNYLLVENKCFYFSYENIVKNGDITLVKSWREFILNYLGNYYYLCKNKEEKTIIQKAAIANELNKKSDWFDFADMDYPFMGYSDKYGIEFFIDRASFEGREKIKLYNLIRLINSVHRFKNIMQTKNKTNKTIKNTALHLKDKKEKAAAKVYLEGFFKENDLDIKFCSSSFATDRNDCIYFEYLEMVRSYTISSWSDYHKPDKYVNVLGFADLEEFAQLIKEEKEKEKEKVFTFQNGLVAKYNANNGFIIIGCKEKDFEFWRKFTN